MHRLIFLACIFLAAPAVACPMSNAQRAKLFEQYDRNGDGLLSQKEYVRAEAQRTKRTSANDKADFAKRFHEVMQPNAQGYAGRDSFAPINLYRCAQD